jgi:hypothetical protein
MRLDAECPVCGAPPAVRAFKADVEAKRDWPADKPVQTVQCQACMARRRVTVYQITAAAYHGAA